MWDDISPYLTPYALPAWLIAIFAGMRLFKDWPGIMQRYNERKRDVAEEKAKDWDRLRGEIERLDKRLNEEIERANKQRAEQEAENERCRHDLRVVSLKLDQAIAHSLKLQAIIDGSGMVRQSAANAAAEVRLDAIDKKDKGK